MLNRILQPLKKHYPMRKNIFLLVASLLININMIAQINALFNVDIMLSCDPMVVQFTDASTSNGTIISWDWDFDDASTDDVPNPVHTFVGPGTEYNVCLTVTDDLAQMDTYCFTVSILDDPIAEAGPDMVITCATLVVELSAAGSSSGPEIAYEWRDPNGNIIGFDIIADVSLPGEYTLIVTDTNTGCTASDVVLVLEDVDVPLIEISTNPFCDYPITLNIGNSSQGPEYTYEWFDELNNLISTSEEIEITEAGIYTLVITNVNTGCTSAASFEVVDPVQISLTVGLIDPPLCAGECSGSLLAAANGGCGNYTYTWSNNFVGELNENLCGGESYSVTVTDCNGCTETVDYMMPVWPDPIELSYDVTCATMAGNDGSIDLSVSGGSPPFTYFWWGSGATTEDIDNLGPGDYVVQVTDVNDCYVIDTIPLSNLILSMNDFNLIACEGEDLQLFVDAPDAVSYLWFPSDNLSCTDCPNPVFNASGPGASTYSVIVEDAAGCIDQGYFGVYIQSYLDFGLLQFSNSPVFEGDTLEFYCNVWNATTVNWSGPDNFSSDECGPIVPNADGGLEGTFFVEIIDEYGCEASATADVDILTIIDSLGENGSICLGGNYQLFVDAPNAISIEWSPAATLDDPFSATPVATPTESTNYFVTVEDASGDIDVASVFVNIENVAILNVAGPPVACVGEDIVICTDGGYPGTYLWTGPNGFNATTWCFPLDDVSMNMAGCYEVVYTSPAGCETSAEFCLDVVDSPPIPNVDISPICAGESVEIDLGVEPNLFYDWFPTTGLSCTNCSNPTASPLETTTYSVLLFYSNGCQTIISIEVVVEADCVWPGDTDTTKIVDNFDLLNIGLAYDSVGPTRDNATILWDGQMAPDWLLTQPGIDVDFKHIDCNGDGVIDANDTLAITQNWGEMHDLTGEDDTEFNFTLDPPFYIDPDTLIEGESISLPVILGDIDNQANDVYGLAFTLEYDSSVVVPGSAKMTFNNGWIGSKGVDMITIQKTFASPGVVDVGMTRIDGEEMDGFGEIGQVSITIEDDILFRNEDDDDRNGDALEVYFNISNVRIINSLGEEIAVNTMETSTVVDGTVGIKSIPWKEYIQIQPNPANDQFFVTSKNIDITNLSLYAITGELLLSQIPGNFETVVNTQKLMPGIYLLKIQTELGIMVERIVIAK